MSILVPRFDPANLFFLDGAGNATIPTGGRNKNEQLVLYNSSLTCMQLTFSDKTTDVIPPAWAKSFKKQNPMGTVIYTPLFALPFSGSPQPISVCYGTVYEFDEHIADINQPLQYVVNIGNAVNVNDAAFVYNSGNPAGTVIVTGIPSGDSATPTTITNNGQILLGDSSYNGLVILSGFAGPNIIVMSPRSATISGSVTGTITIFEWFQGNVKRLTAYMNNYRSASSATYNINSGYNGPIKVETGGISLGSTTDGGIQLLETGTLRTGNAITTLGGSSSGTTTSTSTVWAYSLVEFTQSVNQITFLSNTTAHTGIIELRGT